MSTDPGVAFRFTRIADEAEVQDRRRATLAGVGEAKVVAPQPGTPTPPKRLSGELLAYLRLVYSSPGEPATQRDKLAGIPPARGSRLRARLREMGLLEEFQSNPGTRGSNFKDVRLTSAGLAALETD